METLYIDGDYVCHRNPGEDLRPVETEAFLGKCDGYVEGYRLVPQGEVWVRPDGTRFAGEMIAPKADWQMLHAAQAEYERTLARLELAYREGVMEA